MLCSPVGGLPPPLAAGCGMGEGDCAGDVTRGLLGIEIGAEGVDCAICGVLCETAGDSASDPNWMGAFEAPEEPFAM